MGKNILKVDPVALGYKEIELEKDQSADENDFEWDKKDLEGEELAKIVSRDPLKVPEVYFDECFEEDDF